MQITTLGSIRARLGGPVGDRVELEDPVLLGSKSGSLDCLNVLIT
jgi:hypothetical protein